MPEVATVRSLITPQDKTLRAVFNSQQSYFIDIYQREYKWEDGNVKTLLDDIEVRFLLYRRTKTAPQEIQQDVYERFEPYFLNTYLTSVTPAHTAIVDGQQRLTTFLLVLIKLHTILKDVENDPGNAGKTFSSKVLEKLIYETDDFGTAQRFKIYNENREAAFKALVEGATVRVTDQSQARIAANYKLINDRFDAFFSLGEKGQWDLPKLTYYITYLLERISIVEIRIERQENVAMIFEVVNDRGMGLSPYEILKGKLIGNLPVRMKEEANDVWVDLQEKYFKAELRNTTETKLTLDNFFQTFFRAKFADTEVEYERFDKNYHYEMYRNPSVRRYFGNFEDKTLLHARIIKDIKWFAEVYLDLRTGYTEDYLIYNKLLDQNQQYMLVLSALEYNDPKRAEKTKAIAAKFDQLHVILRLLEAYDSNAFQRLVYPLNKEVRNKSVQEFKPSFDEALIRYLVQDGLLTDGQLSSTEELFEYERFKNIRNTSANISKYVLMRIDRMLHDVMDKPSYAAEPLDELESRFNKNNLKKYGMHLEHILTQHPRNKALFTTGGVFDEAAFQATRNKLGMVLLLKDRQNISSNDDLFKDKVDDYETSNLIWNELLVGHFSSSDLRRLPETLRLAPITPLNDCFPLDKVEDRQRAVFEAVKLVWGNV